MGMEKFLNAAKWELRLGWVHFRWAMPPMIALIIVLFLVPVPGEDGGLYGFGPEWFSGYNILSLLVTALNFIGFFVAALYPIGFYNWKYGENLPEWLSGYSFATLFSAKAVRVVIASLTGHGIIHFAYILQNRFNIEYSAMLSYRFGLFAVIFTFIVVFVLCPLSTLSSLAYHSKRGYRRGLWGYIELIFPIIVCIMAPMIMFFLNIHFENFNAIVVAGLLILLLGVSITVTGHCEQLYNHKAEFIAWEATEL